MNPDAVRAFLLSLPHVAETLQWGDNLVFRVGDQAVGGKMFALLNLSPDHHGVLSFPAGAERFAELVERDGIRPAPYFARIYWVALEHWSAMGRRELEELLGAAHAMTHDKLPRRVREQLAGAGLPGGKAARPGRTARQR